MNQRRPIGPPIHEHFLGAKLSLIIWHAYVRNFFSLKSPYDIFFCKVMQE